MKKTCSAKYLDELEGDLLELFYRDIEEGGLRKAKRKFAIKTLLSPRWHRLPKLGQFQPTVMLRNHLKVAFRHAIRHKSVTIIQAMGLMLGLVAVFYIGLFLKNEWSFDSMHEKGENLYRVLRYNPGTGERDHGTSSLHGARLAEEFPFISVCRFGNDPVKMGEGRQTLVEDFFWTDSTFFELFSFTFLAGDPTTCLDQVNNLVITESLSRQLFGSTQVIGRSLPIKVYDGDKEYLMEITGVVKDPPANTHIQFKALGAMANAEELYHSLVGQWGFSWLRTYIHIPDNRVAEVKAGIPHLIRKYVGEEPPPGFGMTFQAFDDVYLRSQDIARNTFRGSIRNLGIFGSIGLLILIISLMNYINLATARLMSRIKEVGIRKTLGSHKSGIIGQFLVESSLFTLFGGLVAFVLLFASLPHLNDLLELDLSLAILNWSDWAWVIIALFLLGILAGILPSLALSRLPAWSDPQSPVQFKLGNWSLIRKFFVGAQYLITLVLLVLALVINKQYHYLKDFDLGFDSEQLLHLSVDDRQIQERLEVLKERIAKIPGIAKVSATGEDLPSKLNNTWGIDWNGSNPEEPQGIDVVGVDREYFDLLGIEFKSGRNFTHGYAVDSARSVVLNEQALKMMNKENILGEQVQIGGRDRRVIGVVKNHHNTSLHSRIVPLAYFIFAPGARVSADNILIKLHTDNLASLMSQLEGVWKEFSPDPLQYNFVDEAFATAYNAERRFSVLVGFFTLIAIAISVIGLFGLVSFMVQRKLKEISIRRVLGASSFNLMHLLGRDFLIVFLIALGLALPLAIYLVNAWLINYTYRISLNAFLPLSAVLICIGISAMVILFHLYRATRTNPSEVLATE